VSVLAKPDHLNSIQIGILHHLLKCIFHLIRMDERLDKYTAILLSVPAYHDLTPKIKSYNEVSEWNENEMDEMSRYQPGVVTQTLPGGNPTHHPISNCAIGFTRVL